MRTIHTDEIIKNISEMCIEANLHLSKDITNAIVRSKSKEESSLGCQILSQLEENMEIAAAIPCSGIHAKSSTFVTV